MVRLQAGLFAVLLALIALPAAVDAQSRTCRQTLASDVRRIVNAQGEEVVYYRDPVRFLCTGDVMLEADSAVLNRGASAVELVGNVVYRDSTRELRSEWAHYMGRMDQLLARGSMVLRDREGGAVIRGDQLNYLRESPSRPLARMIITGDRPHAIIPPRRETRMPASPIPDAAAPDRPVAADPGPRPRTDTAALSTRVWGDRLELEGESVFRAHGNVDVERGTTVGGGESALFDQAAERITLTTSAFVENESYRLDGDRIDAFMEGDGLREVRSEGAARVTSEDLDVRAPRIRIGFLAGELERLEAWTSDPGSGGPRAHANARDFRLQGDSIDAQADSLGIREVRAVGGAYGERNLATETPERAVIGPVSHGAIDRDWIQGDTILGFFSPESTLADRPGPGAPADPWDMADSPDPERVVEPGQAGDDGTRVVLERIIVIGGEEPALSLYRMRQEGGLGRPAINFMEASRIFLFMEQGDVARVEAEGPIKGLYLDPTGEPVQSEEPGLGVAGGRGSGG